METTLITYDKIVFEAEQNKAKLFKFDESEIWIPDSLIVDHWENDNQIEIPVWFAKKNELI